MFYSKLETYQKQVVKLLDNSFKRNRLVHTYLFHGERGTYKLEAAMYLASLILCETHNACGKCEACQSIINKTNPNVFIISPDNDTIKKEQILALEREFSLTSTSPRIFIIEDIEKATPASANSLLKFLEEANKNCYGVLLTENLHLVLPTIKSRCQIVNFLPINKELIYQELREHNVSEETALVVSNLTTNFDEALNLAQGEVIQDIIAYAKEMSLSFESNHLDSIILLNAKGKMLYQEGSKEYHNLFVDILIMLQNDKIMFLLNQNITFKEFLMDSPPLRSLEEELKILEIIMALKTNMKYNINMDLAYMQMLIKIKR